MHRNRSQEVDKKRPTFDAQYDSIEAHYGLMAEFNIRVCDASTWPANHSQPTCTSSTRCCFLAPACHRAPADHYLLASKVPDIEIAAYKTMEAEYRALLDHISYCQASTESLVMVFRSQIDMQVANLQKVSDGRGAPVSPSENC